MANINVECPHCQTNLETPDSLIGNEVQCPACGKNFVVRTNPPEEKTPMEPRMDSQSRAKLFPSNPMKGRSLFFNFILGMSLALSIISLCLVLTTSDVPKRKFETDPEKAVRAHLTFQKEISSIGDYFRRKNGDAILKSLEIKEIKVNGNWAVAFYKLSLGATEVKKTMMLYKVNDGYWMEVSTYSAKKKCPENWYRDMKEKMERFQKDSGDFDILDI